MATGIISADVLLERARNNIAFSLYWEARSDLLTALALLRAHTLDSDIHARCKRAYIAQAIEALGKLDLSTSSMMISTLLKE